MLDRPVSLQHGIDVGVASRILFVFKTGARSQQLLDDLQLS
jgi:hypothetical protein